MVKKIVSFGFRHGGAPQITSNDLIIDIRRMFRNPYQDVKLKPLRGTDEAVQDYVKKTPDFNVLYNHLKAITSARGIDVVYIGCVGGHHRSVCLAELLSKDLKVLVEHRDIDKK